MRITNPFLLLMQIREHYGSCIRSNNWFLIVLLCPALLFSQVSSLVPCLRELLLFIGDIATNPGPELAVILKQLQNIVEHLKEIKEQRLTSIESKLDVLTALDSKIVSFRYQRGPWWS